jgi:hypothetical protein
MRILLNRRRFHVIKYSGEVTTCDFVQWNFYSIKDVFISVSNEVKNEWRKLIEP